MRKAAIMTNDEFVAALGGLGLPRTSALTSALLGIGWRQVLNLTSGRCPVPPAVANIVRLLELLAATGLQPEEVRLALGIPLPPTRHAERREAAAYRGVA